MKDDRIAREVRVKTAIDTNRVGTQAKATPTAAGSSVTAVTATRNAHGCMVAVDVNGEAEDDYAGGETTAGGGDWNSVTLTRTDAGNETEDTLVIYTDIEAPADKLLTAQYVMLDAALIEGREAKAMSVGFPSAPGTTWDYTGATGERAKTVDGTFDGVPGQFTCTADTCICDQHRWQTKAISGLEVHA